jgi:hypothetical protein
MSCEDASWATGEVVGREVGIPQSPAMEDAYAGSVETIVIAEGTVHREEKCRSTRMQEAHMN